MADLDERLNQLLSDQDTVNRILELARLIQAQRDSQNPEPVNPSVSEQKSVEPDLNTLLSTVLSAQSHQSSFQNETVSENDHAASMSPLVALLPQLMQAMSGQGNLITGLCRSKRCALCRLRLGTGCFPGTSCRCAEFSRHSSIGRRCT